AELADILLILLLWRQSDRNDVARTQTANVQFYTACHKGAVERTRCLPGSEDHDLVLQFSDVAQARSSLVVRPEVFTVGVEDDGPHGHASAAALLHGGGAGVQ